MRGRRKADLIGLVDEFLLFIYGKLIRKSVWSTSPGSTSELWLRPGGQALWGNGWHAGGLPLWWSTEGPTAGRTAAEVPGSDAMTSSWLLDSSSEYAYEFC